jgi:HNH endonuclease
MTGEISYTVGSRVEGRRGAWNTRRRGTHVLEDGMQTDDSTLFRFWSKIDTGTTPDGCWLWTGSTLHTGYGVMRIAGRPSAVHRLAWELAHGPIPAGMFICHHCDVRRCVRPDHLFLGTPADNSADMVLKGRQATGDRAPSRLHRESRPRGDSHPSRRLTSEAVIAIRERFAAGTPRVALAAEYGVSNVTVGKIVRGEAWRHV